MINDTPGKWWLGAQLPPPNPATAVTLDIIRRISSPEIDQIRQANALLSRLAAIAPYAKLFELFQQLQQASTPDGKRSAERMAIDMNEAARAISQAAKKFPNDLARDASLDFEPDTTEFQQIKLAIAHECSKSFFRILTRISELSEGPFKAAGANVVIDSASLTALKELDANISPNTSLVQIIYRGIIIAERLIGRQLKVYEQKIGAASLLIRQIAAEVPDGLPILIRADQLDEAGPLRQLDPMIPEPLALDSALHLHRAIRLTTTLFAKTGEGVLPDPVAAANDTAPSAANDPSLEESAKAAHTPRDQSDSDRGTSPEDESSSTPVDLRALANHATELADSLERAWSDALSPDALGTAHAELESRIGSLIAAIQRQVSGTERSLRDAGIDTRLGAFPPSLTEIKALSYQANARQKWLQAQTAQIDALQLLLEALNAMRAPSAQKIAIPSGAVETWWEAGAFGMLRARARLLVQISMQVSLAADAITGKSHGEDERFRQPFDTLMAARESLSHGDAIGAVSHARRAIMERASLIAPDIPTDLIERLASDARLVNDAPVLNLMQETASRIFRGENVDISIATIIASHAINIAGKLCFETPIIINDACNKNENVSAGQDDQATQITDTDKPSPVEEEGTSASG
jgi:hypothetical protein